MTEIPFKAVCIWPEMHANRLHFPVFEQAESIDRESSSPTKKSVTVAPFPGPLCRAGASRIHRKSF